MAMYIKYSPDSKLVSQWYIGMPVPAITSSVVTFQADGDELTLILAAMNSKTIVPREEPTKEQQLIKEQPTNYYYSVRHRNGWFAYVFHYDGGSKQVTDYTTKEYGSSSKSLAMAIDDVQEWMDKNSISAMRVE